MKHFAFISLFLTICFELASFSHITVNNRPVLTANEYLSRSGYNDFTVDAVNFIKSNDKTFFRINKNYSSGPSRHESRNDAKVQNYYGTSSYHIFNQQYYVKFLDALNVIDGKSDPQTKWIPGLNRLILSTFGSVKYELTIKNTMSPPPKGFSKIGEFGNIDILKDDLYLPLGISFSGYVLEKDFVNFDILHKDITLLNAFIIKENQRNDFSDFQELDTSRIPSQFDFEQYKSMITRLRSTGALKLQRHSQNLIEGSITSERKSLLLLTIPFDKGWSIFIDGKKDKLHLVDFGFMGVILEKGFHHVKLSFYPPFVKSGLIVSIISLILFISLLYYDRRPFNY